MSPIRASVAFAVALGVAFGKTTRGAKAVVVAFNADVVSVTVAPGVTSIEYGAFYGCTSLAAITLPDGLTSIGGCAFARRTSRGLFAAKSSPTTSPTNAAAGRGGAGLAAGAVVFAPPSLLMRRTLTRTSTKRA